jgi:hypothetical protein
MSTFIFGVIMVAIGLTAALADGTDLRWASTASVAALGAAVVILVAALMAPRIEQSRGPSSRPRAPVVSSPAEGPVDDDGSLGGDPIGAGGSPADDVVPSEPESGEGDSSWESAFGVESEPPPGGTEPEPDTEPAE